MDQNYMKESSFELLKASIEAKISYQNDNFTKNELLGRGLLKSFLQQKKITDYSFTEGKFDKVDAGEVLKKAANAYKNFKDEDVVLEPNV